MFEPGRSIVANAGVLLTRVQYLKHTEHKDFAIVDAAMNDLIRPALYQAWMDVQAVRPRDAVPRRYDLVGPICETGDFLAKDRDLALAEGDLLAVRSAGAYGFVMLELQHPRSRRRVLVDGEQTHEVRRRETVQTLRRRKPAAAVRPRPCFCASPRWHGLGNDFMVLDLVSQHAHVQPKHVKLWGDRNTGVGFDQLLIVEAPSSPDVDFRYRIFNADGSRSSSAATAPAASPASVQTSA